ncbi:MAG: hypothetical protein ACKVPJ_00300 [Chitinophagales bacterium]
MMEYKEEQRIKSPLLLGLVLFSSAVVILGMSFFVYEMVKEGQDIYMTILVPLFVLMAFTLAFLLIFRTKLETDVSKEGFGYRYFPILPKRKVIDFNTIVSWQIKKTKLFSELGGFGYRIAIFKRKTGYIMHTNDQVEFILNDGRRKVFSIANTEMMQSFLRKYIAEKEIK